MRNLTPEEQKRLWKKSLYSDDEPIRKIFLWGKDSEKNHCLIVLYGIQHFQETLKDSHGWYIEGHLLNPIIVYTRYAIFRGMNGHLPSIPNAYVDMEKKLLCSKRGYETAQRSWDWNKETRHYDFNVKYDPQYVEKDFYKLEPQAQFDYYAENTYEDYVNTIKANGITFQDVTLIEHPSELFEFEKDSPYYENIICMFSKERLYSRIKNMKEFMAKAPSLEDYEKILNVASVELACGIFQELTIAKNPILLEKAKEIEKSKTLWAKKEYHDGLKRFAKNYLSVFDETLIQKQKDFIYQTLPEMDFHIKRLKGNDGKIKKGKELEKYLYNGIYENHWHLDYGDQRLYDKNTYNNGTNVKNIAFKNTIQMVRAYDMADAAGKIAYYLDAPRTRNYFIGSEKTGAYHYYYRYLRRILDHYKASSEEKFVEAAKEFLAGWQQNENMYSSEFFYRYFSRNKENEEMWDRHIDAIIYVVKHATHWNVLAYCYKIIKKAHKEHKFDDYDIKELIVLSQVPYPLLAEIFENLLIQKLKEAQEFDAEIMLAMMNIPSEKMQKMSQKYFVRTKGKFKPEDIVELLSLDTIENWYQIVKTNIEVFHAEEYIAFIKALAQKEKEYPEKITTLLQDSVEKLNTATSAQKQVLLNYFVDLILQNKKLSEFMAAIAESIIFYMPYAELKEILQDIPLKHGKLSERNHNIVTLLKAAKEDVFPKDSAILSILETSSAGLVKMLTETVEALKETLTEKNTTLLLLLECNVYALNKTAQSVFEQMQADKKQKMHMLLLDSPVERAYQYGLQKLEDWYGDKTPQQFVVRMLEHPCIPVKMYLSQKIQKAFANLEGDLYIYYIKTVLYLPNKAAKSKEQVYQSIPEFVKRYPEKRKEIESILLDIGSTNVKSNAEKALVTFAQIQKEVCSCK